MRTQLDIHLKPRPRRPHQGEQAVRVWSVVEQLGLARTATHTALGNHRRGRQGVLSTADLLSTDQTRAATFSGRDRDEAALCIQLEYSYSVDLSVSWATAPADLLEQVERLAVELDAALGEACWFFFSGLSLPDVEPPPAAASVVHPWLGGPILLDLWDTRLPDAADVLASLTLPEGVRRRWAGNLLLTRWSETLEPGAVSAALGQRERLLIDVLRQPKDGTPRFPRASGTTFIGQPEGLPAAAAALVTALRHGRKAKALLAACSPADASAALGPVCALGRLDAAEALLRAGATLGATGEAGWTPLMWAAAARQVEAVAWLLAQGAPVETQSTRDEVTALHIAAGDRAAEIQLRTNVLDAGARSALGEQRDRMRRIVGQLVAAGCPLDVPNRNGQTALQVAAGDGLIDVCADLLRAGAEPRHRDAEGSSAFEVLAALGQIPALERLVSGWQRR